eukprot:5599723-Pleurochrysis_carterae.AAC.1
MENGQQMSISKEDTGHMNGADGKKLTHKALQVAMLFHERYVFHLAVATDRAKRGSIKDRTEAQRLSETTYGVWQGPALAEIIRDKREKATALEARLGIKLNQTKKLQAVEQGVSSGKLGDSATSAEAELFAMFAILRKVQAQQKLGHYGVRRGKAGILIMSDCLSGLEIIERLCMEKKNNYRRLSNGA